MRVIGIGKKLFHGQNVKQFQAYFKLNDHSLTTTHPSCQEKNADCARLAKLLVSGTSTAVIWMDIRSQDDAR